MERLYFYLKYEDKKNDDAGRLVRTSKLVCFAVWQSKSHSVLSHFNIRYFDLKYLIHTKQAQKCNCVNCLKCSSCESTTPLMELGSISARKGCIGVYFPILRTVIVVVQLLQNTLENQCGYDQLEDMQWRFRVLTEVIARALVGVSPALT